MAESKELAKLRFDISEAESQLKTLDKAFNEFGKGNKNVLVDQAKTNNKIILEDAKKNNKIEVQNNKTYNKLVELESKVEAANKVTNQKIILEDAKKNNKIELQNNQHANRMEEIYARQAKNVKTVWDKMANMANTYLVTRGFQELKNVASEVIQEMTEVEYSMVEIDRVLNESSLDIDNYRDKLIQLAYDYGNSFDNVADVTLRLAQAGFDSNEALKLTESTLLALNTAELNATQATEDMVAVMSQWGLMTGDATQEAADYASIIDKVNKVADNFPTTSEDILEALKKTSSAFNLAGASIDETIAMIVTAEIASQRGGKAIGTAMNNIIQQMKNTSRLATMESLGIEVYTNAAKTEFNSVINILTQLSEKMQQLKKDGKENTTEMQDLLEVFTLFRRNIGAGLLSGIAGEDSNYAKVLATSMDSLGYSLQENEKHMATAKAAQEQFNATLLQLKTAVWDGGAEDVFRSLLLLGNDIVKILTILTKTFGTVPLAIGTATLAFTTFNKTLKAVNVVTDAVSGEITGIVANSKLATSRVKELNEAYKAGEISAQGLKLETIALNAAMSLGLTAAVTGVLYLVNQLINYEENAKKKSEELVNTLNEEIEKNKERVKTIQDLIEQYEKLNAISKDEMDLNQQEELIVVQQEITKQLRLQGVSTKEISDNYDEQINKLKQITKEKLEQEILDQKAIVREKESQNKPVKSGFFEFTTGTIDTILTNAGIDYRDIFANIIGANAQDLLGERFATIMNRSSIEEQVKFLKELQIELDAAAEQGKFVGDAGEYVTEKLKTLTEQEEGLIEAQEKLNEMLASADFSNLTNSRDIKNIEDYKNLLEEISHIETVPEGSNQNLEEYKNTIEELAAKSFPDLNNQLTEISDGIIQVGSEFVTAMETWQDKYNTLTSAMDEYNKQGSLTISTFKNLKDQGLLQYIDILNGKITFNTQALMDSANSAKEKAKADLQAEAAAQILNIIENDLNGTLQEGEAAGAQSANGSNIAKSAALQASEVAIKGAVSWEAYNKAMKGQGFDYSNISAKAKSEINSVISQLNKATAAIDNISLKAAQASKSAGGSSKSATKTFEEESQERVKIFKKEIDDLENLEKSWVNKYKKLELFSTDDLKFITHQRINRYNEYLNQINQLTGISEADRTTLIKEYTAKRQEAELEYFDLLKQKLNDQISDLKEANKERIQAIKDEAQAQIDALKKVEDENDKIKQKEEYERKRNELIYGHQGIEYWRQRTGRDAQLALQDAEDKLKDLDEDWNEKKEGWTLDDQIEQIEKARDAQIAAIEDAQEKQIKGWEDAYNAQVQLYAQTGQIIYDNSVIQAGYLYNAYMDNFVNPLQAQLQAVIASLGTASSSADNVINKMNTISSGGGSSRSVSVSASDALTVHNQRIASGHALASEIAAHSTSTATTTAKKSGNIFSNIISSATSAFKKLIGKFHGGGEVGSSTEALALLRPKEVVLTPEWAAGMNKLIKQINEGKFVSSGTTNHIEVDGNLINMENKINNRQDADYVAEKVEKVLKDKFNIKK